MISRNRRRPAFTAGRPPPLPAAAAVRAHADSSLAADALDREVVGQARRGCPRSSPRPVTTNAAARSRRSTTPAPAAPQQRDLRGGVVAPGRQEVLERDREDDLLAGLGSARVGCPVQRARGREHRRAALGLDRRARSSGPRSSQLNSTRTLQVQGRPCATYSRRSPVLVLEPRLGDVRRRGRAACRSARWRPRRAPGGS